MNKQRSQSLTWLLVKNRLLAQTGLNVFRYETDPKKKRNKLLMMVGIAALLVMMVFYLVSMAVGYALMGLNELTPGIALILSCLITLVFTMLKANGEFFGFQDYDLVMSLPVSTKTVINSRFLNMYIWNTLFSLAVMVPMGAVYSWFEKPDWWFYPLWLIGSLLASLIPTTLAAIFGAVITAVSSKFRYASAVATVLSFVIVIAILVGSMSLGSVDSDLGGLLDSSGNIDLTTLSGMVPLISDSINRFYPPAKLFTDGVVGGQFLSYLLFAGLSIGWYALFVALLSSRYQQINTALTSHRSRADYQLVRLQQGSMVSALYKKTIMRILKSTVAATNLLMGGLMALIASGVLLVAGPEKLLQGMELSGILPIMTSAAPFVIAAMVSMTNTACVSLALEGKQIWLIKSLPIPPKSLYDSYLLVNLTFTIPASLISSILMSVALRASFMATVNLVITPLIFVTASAVIGILIGNRMAYYDWQEETQLVKQSMMSMLGMLGGVIVIGICGVIVNSGLVPIEPLILTIIVNVIVLYATVVVYLKESLRPIKA